MNKDLQAISNLIQQSAQLSDEEKKAIVKSLKDADKELEITTFKLDRTEKVKKTTAILLEETIAELEQKRKAVETQNRELEIETSLERVRTVAMGMRKADDLLDVCQALFAELHTLGFDELRNAMINIFSNDSISFLNYDYSENAGKTITTHYYNSHPVIEKQVNEIRSSHDAFSETVFSGKDLEEWRAFRKEKGEKDDPKMDTIPALFYYFYSIGTGAIGISTYSSIPDEKLNVLKRFRNVFDLAYRRFIDIEKAEAQARESQIQLSLERVRARTMAMQKSDELPDAANLLFQQVQSLGMPTWSAGYCIWDEDKKAITLSMSRPWGDIQPSFRVPLDEDPSFIHFLEAHNNGEELFVEEVTGKALEQNYEYLRTLPVVGDQLDSIIKEGHSLPTYQVNHCAYFSKGFLLFITYEQVSESHEIFKRFAKVFEQTYTRFLDLQKAEIQSREAQIELALERVRARTMAMQHSEELMEAANLLFQQVQSLGIEIWSCGFNIWDIGQKFCTGWMSVNGALQPPFRIPLTDSFTFIHMDQSRQKKESFYIEEVSGEALADHYRYMFSLPDFKVSADEHLKAGFKLPESQTNHVYNFNHGNLIFLSYKPIPEAANIFKRFTAVFEQTYTRFLDLQKAEAQAREAQIQLSLERVRARTMAMQKSDELPDAANLLFHQMQSLGMPAWSAGYCIWDANKQGITLWMSSEGVMQPSFHTPLTEDPSFIHFREAYERGESFHVEAVGGEELVSHYKYMRTLPGIGEVLDSIIDAGHPLPTFQIFHCAYFSQGFLLFITYEPVPEAHDIFKRFAKVFEQTYTRFLDLQKSEAQARESQIQLALERVRARTMAMQKSDELSETVFILFQQFKQLGENPDQATIGIINEDEWVIEYWVTMYGSQTNRVYKFPVSEPNVTNRIYNAWKEQRKSLVIELSGKELYDFAHFRESMGGAAYNPEEKKRVINVAFFSKGIINVQSNESRSEESIRLLERFAKVFEQTYTRFLDLQKAEAQARESQIQLALERVRAKSLAMHGSNELADVITILNEQLRHLGLLMEMRSAAILILEEGKKDYTQWIASPLYDKAFSLATPYLDNRIQNDIWEARQNKTGYYSKSYNVQEKNELFRFYFKQPAFSIFSEEEKNVILESPHYELSLAFEKNSSVGIAGLTGNLLSNEEGEIVKRAAKVFEQAYIRFLDLQKAEAQTREALIEAALEKVRSRTMAMHSSEDVSLATTTMFTELEKLGIENFRGGILNIKENKTMDVWSVNKSADSDPNDPLGRGKTIRAAGEWDMTLHPWWIELYKGWVNKEEFSYYMLAGKEKEDYVRILDARRDYIPGGIKELPDCHIQGYYFSEGAVWTFSLLPHPEEHKQVMKRFASVFSLTFRRYQDLLKAEAQAREAIIEASLERIRSSAMAMHSSDDVVNATGVVFRELHKLGIETMRCGILIIDEDQTMEVWSVTDTEDGKTVRGSGRFDMKVHPLWKGLHDAWKQKEDHFYYHLAGEDKNDYYRILTNSPKYFSDTLHEFPDQDVEAYNFRDGALWTFSLRPHSEADKQVLKRFTAVFSLTLRRYQDLKKAEEQAKESQIEAALERVRSRSMGMQKSEELSEVIQIVFNQLVHLNFPAEHTGFVMDYKTREDYNLWIADRFGSPSHVTIPYFDSIYYNTFNEAKENGVDFFVTTLSFEEKNKFYEELFNHVPGLPEESQEIIFNAPGYSISTALLENVSLYIENFTGIPFSDEENAILIRFGKVFQQTYTRFLDLQRAEAQALEAIKRASVDRVRAEIASMRTTSDLERITPLIWNELTTLGVPFIRCGVFIMDEEKQQVQTFLYTEGKAIASFTSSFSNSNLIIEALPYWRRKEIYKTHWDEAAFLEQARNLVEQGSITSGEKYLTEHRPTDLYLHFLPFLQGMLYVGDAASLSDEHLQLVQALAEAFSTAYARYEDFNKLEAAKKQVDSTLTELQATQKQLIQSEKMASLGELTAGIAHEIQNPLNFVNNFSEVSKELIEELESERSKVKSERDETMEVEILNDIKQNLEKINHHGKRADAIVKGMLQHSRSTGNEKQPTDINALADEYLRLAYHGLRAKDKSFNATMKTDYDETIGKINIIPQDVGRVLLNLYNNAFYAVNERRNQQGDGYEPTVSVNTKKLNGKVEICVKDNGNGITQKVIDKIFQPFFTTKPTGQGTGLGLSLAYDIVKAHGGELKVESMEGGGAAFIVGLPILQN